MLNGSKRVETQVSQTSVCLSQLLFQFCHNAVRRNRRTNTKNNLIKKLFQTLIQIKYIFTKEHCIRMLKTIKITYTEITGKKDNLGISTLCQIENFSHNWCTLLQLQYIISNENAYCKNQWWKGISEYSPVRRRALVPKVHLVFRSKEIISGVVWLKTQGIWFTRRARLALFSRECLRERAPYLKIMTPSSGSKCLVVSHQSNDCNNFHAKVIRAVP